MIQKDPDEEVLRLDSHYTTCPPWFLTRILVEALVKQLNNQDHQMRSVARFGVICRILKM